MADDFWREAVALKRYRSHPTMLIGDEPQSYPSYRDIAHGGKKKRFDVAVAQSEAEIEPDGLLDDDARKAVSAV